MKLHTSSIFVISSFFVAAGCHAGSSDAARAPAAEAAPVERAALPTGESAPEERAASETGEAAEGEEEAAEGETERPRIKPEPGQLTAGEWSDVEDWDFWLSLMENQDYQRYVDEWDFALDRRISVEVVGPDGRPARNVAVQLLDGESESLWTVQTNGDGEAVLFARPRSQGPFTVRLEDGQKKQGLTPGESVRLALDSGPDVQDAIDVMFVVDTTGSMGDELSYIQSELTDVARRVQKQTHNEFALRMGATVYRDHSDDYLVRSSGLTTDVADTSAWLARESARGGGDFPEAVDEALAEAIHNQAWNESARARVVFLVLDAPPHPDSEGKERLQRAVNSAAERGIQIVPVVGSGIDKNTEFLMRSIAISTQGTYVFLTNHSGIGNSHIEPTTGDYQVEFLNDLLVRLIVDAAS